MNKITGFFLAGAAVILGMSMMLQGGGCMSMISVNVPTGMTQALGGPSRIRLSETEDKTSQWKSYVTRTTAQWEDNLDDAWFVYGILSSLGNLGLESIESLSIGGFPVGGLLVTMLGFGGGYQITNGRDKRKLSEREKAAEKRGVDLTTALFEAKIKSFNAGRSE